MTIQKDFSNATTGALTIRFSAPSDVPAVLDFYNNNRHDNVDFRGEDIFADRTEKNRALLVFLPDNTLGAVSMSHPTSIPYDKDKTAGWTEIGSTLAKADGFSLYPLLIASQTVHEFFDKTPEAAFFACVHKENAAVTRLLNKKVGWNVVTPSQSFANAIGEGANIDKLNWLHATSDTLAHQARIVLEQIEKGTITNKKGGEVFTLNMKGFSLATTFRAQVEELATGRFGEMLENCQPMSLKNARAAFDLYRNGTQFFPQFVQKP